MIRMVMNEGTQMMELQNVKIMHVKSFTTDCCSKFMSRLTSKGSKKNFLRFIAKYHITSCLVILSCYDIAIFKLLQNRTQYSISINGCITNSLLGRGRGRDGKGITNWREGDIGELCMKLAYCQISE